MTTVTLLWRADDRKRWKDEEYDQKGSVKLLLFRDTGPSFSQPGWIDIRGLDCANSTRRREGQQHSCRFLKIGKLRWVQVILKPLFSWQNFYHLYFDFNPLCGKTLIYKSKGTGWEEFDTCQSLLWGPSLWLAVSDWLFQSSPLLLDKIIATRIKWLIGWQNMPDSFSFKIKYLCIYLYLEKQ